jgi:hypothetical protein
VAGEIVEAIPVNHGQRAYLLKLSLVSRFSRQDDSGGTWGENGPAGN